MSSNAISEKSATHDIYASMPPPPPNPAHLQPTPYNFLPSFEAQVNASLCKLHATGTETGQHDFEATRLSDRDKKRRRKTKRNLTIIAVITLASVCALVTGVLPDRLAGCESSHFCVACRRV